MANTLSTKYVAYACLLGVILLYTFTSFSRKITIAFPTFMVEPLPVMCPNVFPEMLHGKWVPKENVTVLEVKEMDEYLADIRKIFSVPPSLQRPDGRCGNVTYEGVNQYHFMWIKAVCNPKGATPCCREFACVYSSIADCQCSNCFDSRVPVHSELSKWQPDMIACRPKIFSHIEACEMLKGTTLWIAGDSLLRHVYTALAIYLTNNFRDGALRQDSNQGNEKQICVRVRMEVLDVVKQCLGMYQINGRLCRGILDENRTLCSGTVHILYTQVFPATSGSYVLPMLKNMTSQNRRVLLLAGIGIHDDFNVDVVWKLFAQPLADYVSQRAKTNVTQAPVSIWPKLVWVNPHAPGLLKTPVVQAQTYESVKKFIEEMTNRLRPYKIPIMDTFNMTAPIHSTDGTHYGYGANMAKVHFLINWIKERHERKEW